MLKPIFRLVVATSAAFSLNAPAVEINPAGSGQAQILPIWTTTGGHSTLINIQATGSVVARLRLLDAAGAPVFSANIYFQNAYDLANVDDSWAAGIGAREGGGGRLSTSDGTCVLVDGEGGAQPFTGAVDFDAAYGSAELIAMGVFPSDYLFDCESLAQRWNEGAWHDDAGESMYSAPADALFVNASIVQVDRGTLYHVPSTALVNYSDQVQHTLPGSELPNLASGHDAGTGEGATHSRLCNADGCREDDWPTPLDAVAAALTANNHEGDYSIEPGLGAATDLVLSFPLQPYFAGREGMDSPLAESWVSVLTADRDGGLDASLAGVICPSTSPPGTICPNSLLGMSKTPLMVVSFNPAEGAGALSNVLAIPSPQRLSPDLEQNVGSFFTLDENPGIVVRTSNGGSFYTGEPIIAVVFQQFVNGVLPAEDGIPQRANYGSAFAPARR